MAKLHVQTANYVMRPLTPADITDEWGGWLADPRAAELLNAPCRALTRQELAQYVSRFDNKKSILLGVFHRQSGKHIGIFTMLESQDGRHVLFNVFMGAAGFHTLGGPIEMRELRTAIGNFIFFERGYLTAVASVVAGNAPMIAYLKLAGWELVKRSTARGANGGADVELLSFRLTRERYVERDGASWTKKFAERSFPDKDPQTPG